MSAGIIEEERKKIEERKKRFNVSEEEQNELTDYKKGSKLKQILNKTAKSNKPSSIEIGSDIKVINFQF